MSEGRQQGSIHTGSSFQDFLEEEGLRNDVQAAAIKRVLAWQFEQAMDKQKKTKQVMAKQLKTSRSQLDRLLDPANTAVSLETLTRAANVLGKQLVLEIRDYARASANGEASIGTKPLSIHKETPYVSAAKRYRPKSIGVLFVAEAPPEAAERYFFYEGVDRHDSLWVALMKGLYPEEWNGTKTERTRKEGWLRKFKDSGCWLVDAVEVPLSGPPKQKVRVISSAADQLIAQIRKIKPQQIVLIKTTVHNALFQKLKQAGLSVVNETPLPFPCAGQQTRFHIGLRRLVESGRIVLR